jgi:hypothetical protein
MALPPSEPPGSRSPKEPKKPAVRSCWPPSASKTSLVNYISMCLCAPERLLHIA